MIEISEDSEDPSGCTIGPMTSGERIPAANSFTFKRYAENFSYSPDEPYYPWGPVEPDADGDYVLYDEVIELLREAEEALSCALICSEGLPEDVRDVRDKLEKLIEGSKP